MIVMVFQRALLLCLVLLILVGAGCTTSKWTVVDEDAVNEAESPVVVSQSEVLVATSMPTIEDPILTLEPRKIAISEQPQRVKIQRMVQQYKPKWMFSILSLAGAGLSFTAANTDLLLTGTSISQKVALNATALLLTTLSVTNLKEKGDPIQTDEVRYLRETGFVVMTDTVEAVQPVNQTADINIALRDEVVFRDSVVQFSDNSIDINMGSIGADWSDSLTVDSQFIVTGKFNETESATTIPVQSFMKRSFIVYDAVAQLRSSATAKTDNIIAELGQGSSLLLIEEVDERWVKIEYGSVEAFLQKSTGNIVFKSTAESGPALLVELTDIPFGDVDVENSLPVLKPRNENDRAVVLSGLNGNQAGIRQFASRDTRLFKHYMHNSLSMENNQIVEINDPDLSEWQPALESLSGVNGGSAVIYLTGFTTRMSQNGDDDLALYYVNEDGYEQTLPLRDIFEKLANFTAEKLFLFVDLEYIRQGEVNGNELNGNKLQSLSNILLKDFPNAFILFGNDLSQEPSLYSGDIEDDKRHHIFPYFLAEALQQRKTQMSDLYRHLENNVDYTSRRLHDQSQTVHGFGNFMLNLAE